MKKFTVVASYVATCAVVCCVAIGLQCEGDTPPAEGYDDRHAMAFIDDGFTLIDPDGRIVTWVSDDGTEYETE